MNKRLTLATKLRMSHVKRWHMVSTVHPQSVAEHSYRVYLIASEMAQAMQVDYLELVEQWALWHDIPEVVLGDIPTPTKTMMSALDELSVDDDYRSMHEMIGKEFPAVFDIVRIADVAEAMAFLREEGIGVRARDILGEIEVTFAEVFRVARHNHPLLDWNAAEVALERQL
jgi:5'-deoxynucleotidase YfbR-like HD superfamily hydrolase